jgi:hypothetical protein
MPDEVKKVTVMPEWAKFTMASSFVVIISTVGVIGWAQGNFVTRLEWAAHAEQQRADFLRVSSSLETHSNMDRVLQGNFGDINARLVGIEADVSWLRAYLGSTATPKPRKVHPNYSITVPE